MISAIVAVDNNWGIGFNGDLLERIPEDLKYFQQLTTGNVVVMGRKTWESLPKKPLPNRWNNIITRQHINNFTSDIINYRTLEDMQNFMLKYSSYNYFIIGGGEIYKELLPLCDRVYVTKINKSHENVDTYFPNLDESEEWAPASCSPIYDYKDFTYQFWQYDRI
jgi:dihydrofolate reductase